MKKLIKLAVILSVFEASFIEGMRGRNTPSPDVIHDTVGVSKKNFGAYVTRVVDDLFIQGQLSCYPYGGVKYETWFRTRNEKRALNDAMSRLLLSDDDFVEDWLLVNKNTSAIILFLKAEWYGVSPLGDRVGRKPTDLFVVMAPNLSDDTFLQAFKNISTILTTVKGS
jgi:hypothetical protein